MPTHIPNLCPYLHAGWFSCFVYLGGICQEYVNHYCSSKSQPYTKRCTQSLPPLHPCHPIPIPSLLSTFFPPFLYKESIILISGLCFLNLFCTNGQILVYFLIFFFFYIWRVNILETCLRFVFFTWVCLRNYFRAVESSSSFFLFNSSVIIHCVDTRLCNSSPIYGHLGFSHYFAITNAAAMNNLVYTFLYCWRFSFRVHSWKWKCWFER